MHYVSQIDNISSRLGLINSLHFIDDIHVTVHVLNIETARLFHRYVVFLIPHHHPYHIQPQLNSTSC